MPIQLLDPADQFVDPLEHVLTPLVLLTIFFGFYPAPILDATAVSVDALIKNFNASLAAAEQARLALMP